MTRWEEKFMDEVEVQVYHSLWERADQGGATTDDVALATNLPISAVRGKIRALSLSGFARPSGRYRKTRAGSMAKVWVPWTGEEPAS